jgi:hypothetical protein
MLSLVEKPPEKRKFGRCRTRWEDNTMMSLDGRWVVLPHIRVHCLVLVLAVLYFRVIYYYMRVRFIQDSCYCQDSEIREAAIN